MVPAYTSFSHGQNFVQKDWVNGISPHGPDEEGIGSTIIIFYHKINVVLLKKKRCTHCDDCKMDWISSVMFVGSASEEGSSWESI